MGHKELKYTVGTMPWERYVSMVSGFGFDPRFKP